MAMMIVHTSQPAGQVEKDRPKLEKMHEESLRSLTLWGVFGGTLSVDGREYQVCEDPRAKREGDRR